MDKVESKDLFAPPGDKSSLRFINKADLNVDQDADGGYQRQQSPFMINKIFKEFSWDLFGALIVGMRANGKYYVIDGATRLRATLKRPDIRSVPCVIHEGTTRQQEAAMFQDINRNRRCLNPISIWNAALCAKDPNAIEINRTIAMYGFQVATASKKRVLNCPLMLLDIGADATDDLLRFVTTVWPDDELHTRRYVLDGLVLLQRDLAAAGIALNSPQVQKKFSCTSLTALTQKASTFFAISNGSKRHGMAKAMKAHWQKGRRMASRNDVNERIA